MLIIAPYAKKLKTGTENPKNYPYWKELIAMIDDPIVQVGVEGEEQLVPDFRKNLSIKELRKLIQACDTWISCDSFMQHLAWDEGKKGIVLWSVSDPNIYGHPENINLLKDRKYLAENQFYYWELQKYEPDSFIDPAEVKVALDELLAIEKSAKIASNTHQMTR